MILCEISKWPLLWFDHLIVWLGTVIELHEIVNAEIQILMESNLMNWNEMQCLYDICDNTPCLSATILRDLVWLGFDGAGFWDQLQTMYLRFLSRGTSIV